MTRACSHRKSSQPPRRSCSPANDETRERAMAFGPVQILVIGFGDAEFKGTIRAELERLREHDVVRLIDLLVVRKDEDGTIERLQQSDPSQDEAMEFGAVSGAVTGDPHAAARLALDCATAGSGLAPARLTPRTPGVAPCFERAALRGRPQLGPTADHLLLVFAPDADRMLQQCLDTRDFDRALE